MQSIIKKINLLVNELKSLPTISEDNQRKLDKKFRLEFSYNSNHIEGNTLTYGETELLLIFDKTDGVHEMREYEEMKAHDVAYQLLQNWSKDVEHPLTETYIKQLNEIILVKPFWKEAQTPDGQSTKRLISIGEYKKHPNSVRLQNGEIFNYATPTDTPIKMGELLEWYNLEVEKKELHPLELAALLHYKFVCIHPFDDDNGRISRLLMNYVLLKNSLPPVIIKTADKKAYLNALNQADVGNIEAFIKYIAEQVIWSIEIKIKATKGVSIEEDNDLDKEIAILQRDLFVNNKKSIIRDEKILLDLWKNSILPFFVTLEDSLGKFNHFFKTYLLTIDFLKLERDEKENLLHKSIERELNLPLIERIEYEKLLKSVMPLVDRFEHEGLHYCIETLEFDYTLIGLMGNASAEYINTNLKFIFNEINYQLIVNNEPEKIIIINYSDYLTDKEIKKLKKEVTEVILGKIKKYNGL
jgi:Fic family protein